MTKTQVEVITSVQRRRRWSRAEKERIVAAAMEPGAIASEIARAAGIHTSQLWRPGARSIDDRRGYAVLGAVDSRLFCDRGRCPLPVKADGVADIAGRLKSATAQSRCAPARCAGQEPRGRSRLRGQG